MEIPELFGIKRERRLRQAKRVKEFEKLKQKVRPAKRKANQVPRNFEKLSFGPG